MTEHWDPSETDDILGCIARCIRKTVEAVGPLRTSTVLAQIAVALAGNEDGLGDPGFRIYRAASTRRRPRMMGGDDHRAGYRPRWRATPLVRSEGAAR